MELFRKLRRWDLSWPRSNKMKPTPNYKIPRPNKTAHLCCVKTTINLFQANHCNTWYPALRGWPRSTPFGGVDENLWMLELFACGFKWYRMKWKIWDQRPEQMGRIIFSFFLVVLHSPFLWSYPQFYLGWILRSTQEVNWEVLICTKMVEYKWFLKMEKKFLLALKNSPRIHLSELHLQLLTRKSKLPEIVDTFGSII